MVQAIWLCLWRLFVLFILFSKKCFLELTHVFTFALDFFSCHSLWAISCNSKVQAFSIIIQRKRKWLGFKVQGGKTSVPHGYYLKWGWVKREVTCIFCSGHHTSLKPTQPPRFPGHESYLVMWWKGALWNWDVAPDEIYRAEQRDSALWNHWAHHTLFVT